MKPNNRLKITKTDLLETPRLQGPVDNIWFKAVEGEGVATHQLSHKLRIARTKMNCNYEDVKVTGQCIDLFPQVELSLVSSEDGLVPLERDLLRDPDRVGYWDLTVSPGRIWSEPEDEEWSRAAFPFQLSNIFENDTHHGIAMFLYNNSQISPLFFQIVAETKTFVCPENLIAWGYLNADCESLLEENTVSAMASFKEETHAECPLLPLSQLLTKENKSNFETLDQGIGSESTLLSGLVMDGTIYATPCKTHSGSFPYPRGMKFGIWSATKTAFCTVACLRLAQTTGQDPRKARVSDLLPEAAGKVAWQEITIGDCLNMASGIGTAGMNAEPENIFADYLLEKEQAEAAENGMESFNHYFDWFLAPSQHEKNVAAFACPSYEWGPGQVTRYRDQDLYIAGAALDAWMKNQLGSRLKIWDMLVEEVYKPAGIYHPVMFQTVETDLTKEVPLSDAGLLLTMDNIAMLGELILNQGRIDQEQVLHSDMLDEFFNPSNPKGLPTGTQTEFGEILYHGGIWHLPYQSLQGKDFWIPTMRGHGGQLIQTLPNDTTVFRFAFDSYDTEERYDMLKMVKLSDAVRAF